MTNVIHLYKFSVSLSRSFFVNHSSSYTYRSPLARIVMWGVFVVLLLCTFPIPEAYALTLSGHIYTNEGTTELASAGKTISLRIGTSTPGFFATSTIAATGYWQISDIAATGVDSGIPLSVWVDGDSTFRAFTFTKASSSVNNISSIDLYQNYVIVKHEGFTGTSTTNADLNVYDADDDTDIQFRVTGTAFAQNATNTLYVAPGSTFAPGGTTTLHGNASTANGDGDLRLATGARQDGVGTTSILSMAGNALTLAGNWFASSTSIFTHTATTTFNSTSTATKLIVATTTVFNNIAFDGVGGRWSFGANAATTSGNFALYDGHALQFSGTSAGPDNTSFIDLVTINTASSPENNSFEVPSTGTYIYNPTGGTWTFGASSGIERNGSAFGATNAPDGVQAAFMQNGTNATISQLLPLAPGTYTVSFYAARRSGQVNPIQVSIDGTNIGGTITPADNNFTQYTTSSFVINGEGEVIVPSTSLTIGGNYTNSSGIFTHNSGTVYFSSTTAQTIGGIMTGSSAFASTTFIGSGTKTFSRNASTTNFTIGSGSGAVTAPSTDLTISGNYTNNSTFTHNSGTVYFSSTTAQTLSGTMTGTSAFASTTFDSSGTKTFSNNASTTNHFTINSGATVVAPTLLTIGGNYTQNGTFTHNGGTVYASPSSNVVSQIGSGLAIAGNGYVAIARLLSTSTADVAFLDGSNDSLRTYRWNGSTWTLVGSGLALSGVSIPALASMATTSSDIAEVSWSGNTLRTYRFNGSTWSQVGSGLVIGGMTWTAITGLNSSDIAFVDGGNESLRTYRFDGSNWSQVGSSLAVSGAFSFPALTMISTSTAFSDVAFVDNQNQSLRTYRWDGSTWAQVGSGLTVSGTGYPALATIATTTAYADVVFTSSTTNELRTYRWNGSTWIQVGGSIATTGTSETPALALIATTTATDVAFINDVNDTLRTYRFNSPNTLSGAMTGTNGFNNIEFAFVNNTSAPAPKTIFVSNASTTGNLTISSGATVLAPPSLTIGGNYTQNGTFTHNSGTVYFSSTTAQSIAGTMTGSSAFASTTFIGSGTTKTFSNNASTTNHFTVNGGVTVVAPSQLTIGGNYTNSGTFTAPSTNLTISGNYTNSGTFTHNAGLVYLNGTSQQTLSGTMTGTSAFRSLTIVNTSGTGGGVGAQSVNFSSAASTTGLFTMAASTSAQFASGTATSSFNGINWTGAAGSPIWLRSSNGGTPWGLVATNTQAVSYVNVKDSYACAGDSIANGDGTDATGNTCWTFPINITLSGRIYSDEGTTQLASAGKTLTIRIGTSTPGFFSTTTVAATGFWQISNILDPGLALGTPLSAWIDGDTSFRAFTLTKASSTSNDISIDLYKNYVIVKHEAFTGTSTTNADLAVYDKDDDADIGFTAVSGGALNVYKEQALYIAPGTTFAPGGTITLHGNASTTNPDGDLRLATGARQDGVGTTSILTMEANSFTLAGNWLASSTSVFTHSGTVTVNSTSTAQKRIVATSSPFSNLIFNGSGGSWTFAGNAATTTDNFTITNGTVTAPSTNLTIGGNYSNSGTFTNASGTVYFSSTTAQTLSGTMIGTSAFATTTFTGSGIKTFSNNASTTNHFTINSGATVVAPPLLTIGGNYTQNGTFTHNGGTVYASPSSNVVSEVGSGLNVTCSGYHGYVAMARLLSTSTAMLAHAEGTWDCLRAYRWNGSTWAQVGSSLDIPSLSVPALASMATTTSDVAFIDTGNVALRTYRFNGSTWSQVGSSLVIGGMQWAALAGLNSSDVAFIDGGNESLRTYRFNGSTWAQVGSGLAVGGAFNFSALATISTSTASSDVAFIDDINDTLRTYRWNGSTWAQVGSGLSIPSTAYPALATIATTTAFVDVVFTSTTTGELRTYRWNGSTWVQVGGSIAISGSSETPALVSIATTTTADVAFVNDVNDTLRTYRFNSPNTLSGAMTGTNGFNNIEFAFVNNTSAPAPKTIFSTNASTSNFTISSGATVIAPSNNLTIGGNYANSGTFTNNSGTIYFSSTTAQSIAGTMTGTSAFASTTFIGSGLKTFSNNASTTNHFTINSGATVIAPALLSIAGNYTNSGTFTHNAGLVYLNGTSQQTLSGTMTGTSAFRSLTIVNTSGTGGGVGAQSVNFSSAASTTGLFTMAASTSAQFASGTATSSFNGINWTGAAGSPIWLRSSNGGTPWGLVATNTQAVSYVNVKDSYACAGDSINVANSTNSGGNSCWNFEGMLSISYYRFREDNGTELAATYSTAENTALGTSSNMFIGDRKRLRFSVANTGDASASGITYRLEHASSSCTSWYAVPAYNAQSGQEWVMDQSQWIPDGAATTHSSGMSVPSGKSFVAGQARLYTNQTSAHTLTMSEYTEFEFAFRSTNYVQSNIPYCFRLTNAGSITNFSYVVEPRLVINPGSRPEYGGGGSEASGSGAAHVGGGDGGGSNSEGSGGGAPHVGGGDGGGSGDSG